MAEVATFWDNVAEKYARRPIADEAAYQHTLDRVASYLQRDQSVLELGCGSGATAVKLSKYVGTYLATDISPKMVDIGRSRMREVAARNLQFAVMEPMTVPPGTYDVVMAFNLFHLMPQRRDNLHAVAMRLKPGGLFISKTVCLASTRSLLKRMLLRPLIPLMQLFGKAPEVVDFMTTEAWQAEVEAAGFEVIESGDFPADPPSRFIVARKR